MWQCTSAPDLICLGSVHPDLAQDGSRLGNEVDPFVFSGDRQGIRGERHCLPMPAVLASNLGEGESRIDGLRLFFDDLLQQPLAPLSIAAQHAGKLDEQRAFRRERIEVSGVEFEGAVEFVHHPAELEHRRHGFPIDAELLAKVTEQGKMGIVILLIQRNRPFGEGLSFQEMGQPLVTVLCHPPVAALRSGLLGEIFNGVSGQHRYR